MRSTWHPTQRLNASMVFDVMLANTGIATLLKVFAMLVLFLLVRRTADACGPFVDETGRLLRDCVAYVRTVLRHLLA